MAGSPLFGEPRPRSGVFSFPLSNGRSDIGLGAFALCFSSRSFLPDRDEIRLQGIRFPVRISLEKLMQPTPGPEFPPELEEVAQRLRAERREGSALELDAIKTRVFARARTRSERSRRRSRILVPLVALSILAGATGGVIAGT